MNNKYSALIRYENWKLRTHLKNQWGKYWSRQVVIDETTYIRHQSGKHTEKCLKYFPEEFGTICMYTGEMVESDIARVNYSQVVPRKKLINREKLSTP